MRKEIFPIAVSLTENTSCDFQFIRDANRIVNVVIKSRIENEIMNVIDSTAIFYDVTIRPSYTDIDKVLIVRYIEL